MKKTAPRIAGAGTDVTVEPGWISAAAASELLGVRLETLYAYVSRGLIESRSSDHGRPRMYARSDVDQLKRKHDARRGHGAVAASALAWGEPVLDSAITAVTAGGPAYRGHLATDLARAGASFEAVSELLWTRNLPSKRPIWERPKLSFDPEKVTQFLAEGSSFLDTQGLVLALMRSARGVSAPLADPLELDEARRILPVLAAAPVIHTDPKRMLKVLRRPSVAEIVLDALRGSIDEDSVREIERVLVVVADHELNASAFGARVAASAGTDLLGAVVSALGILTGVRHGGVSDRVEALVQSIESERTVSAAISARLYGNEAIVGFGHPLYSEGDPRASLLLEAVRRPRKGSDPRLSVLLSIVDELAARDYSRPSLDIGLVALRMHLGLPRGSAGVVFAVGRAAGWIAHILEQRAQKALLRPRARYVGEALVPAAIKRPVSG